MDNHTPEFTPELVDAQVDRLLARQLPASQHAQIVDDLQQMYQDDERSLRKVWHLLELENQQTSSMEKLPEMVERVSLRPQPTSAKVLNLERNRPMRQASKRPLTRVFSLIAAACIAALIVGSMLFILHLVHKNQAITASNTSQSLYASDSTGVFKLDPQTHQTLWRETLKGVTTILPAGKGVYILQSSMQTGVTDAVLELDASSGKTLWAYTFPSQQQNTKAFARGMVLAQDRLYVGWQTLSEDTTRNGGTSSTAQIYVLKASDGSKLLTYPTAASVWSMEAGAGVLAMSADGSLQVYDLTSGKALWHKSFPASTNAPVVSLRIANGLIYAVVIAIDAKSNANLSSILVYRATTGEQIWQSPTFASDVLSFLTVNQSVVYFGTTLDHQPGQKKPVTGRIYAYDVQTNTQLWSTPVVGAPLHQPIFDKGVLYLAIDSGPVDNIAPAPAHIVALNAATGALKWQQTLASNYIGGFCLGNGTLYASSYTVSQSGITWGKSSAFKASDGHLVWEDSQHSFFTIVASAPN